MKRKSIAVILALFLGMFGAHKFYLRKPQTGFFYFFLFFVSTRSISVPITVFLAFFDAIRLLMMSKRKFNNTYNGGYVDKQRIPKRTKKIKSRGSSIKQNPFKKRGKKKYLNYDIEEAILEFEKGLKIQPKDISLHYNLACSYSLLENAEKAFYHIEMAIKYGFSDEEKILTKEDLAFLRIQPEFENFKNNGYKKIKQAVSEKVTVKENLLEKLSEIVELRKRGMLTETEFVLEKQKILRKSK